MDPRGVGSVSVELNNTAAQLLASLCARLETDDATGVLSRALGLLDLSLRNRVLNHRDTKRSIPLAVPDPGAPPLSFLGSFAMTVPEICNAP